MWFLPRFWSTDRSLTVLLLSLAVFTFVIIPLGALDIGGQLVLAAVFSLLLISGVGAVANSMFLTVLVGSLVFAGLALRWVRLSSGARWLAVPDAFSSALLCVLLAVVVLVQVFREGPITPQRVQGAVAAYLLLALAWAFTYKLIAIGRPEAFAGALGGTDASPDLSARFVYFSFVTLTTMGYGDITPVHPMARALATAEALVGQLYPAILLARLVSMELYYRQANDADRT